jgi:tRNA(Ile)-lysidine synthase
VSLVSKLLSILRTYPQVNHCHLAYSGGLDSTVLLHLLHQVAGSLSWRGLRVVHVHHGLQAGADQWQQHCEAFCRQLDLPLTQIRLELREIPGTSLEALARERRYQALASAMGADDLLLTAQHQDDQAETLLLQLLRGSGPAGLAAMPALTRFGPGWHGRPLLGFARAELERYAEEEGLTWVEDPSNRDLRFDRNYLRHEVLPRLQQRWPAALATIARSARLSGELQALADEQAARDLELTEGPWPGTLSISLLRGFSSPRRRSLLRHWIRKQGLQMPGSRHLQRIERECLESRPDATPIVHWHEAEVRRYRDGLFLLKPLPDHDPAQVIPWLEADELVLPDGLGRLVLEPAEQGIRSEAWRSARVEVRFRQGGEVCQQAGKRLHQSLKKRFQEWGIPPWQRDRLPLIHIDGELAAVPGWLLCEPFRAAPGEAAVMPRWVEAED